MDDTSFEPKRSTLYAVATPIGNLRDITLRALDVLRRVDCIAAEDTRVTGVLLSHYGIRAPMLALHAHNEKRQAERVAAMLAEGRSVALVTDAGSPGLSDPGAEVVAAVRTAGFAVEPIPGASALTAALSVVGWNAVPFTFHGFLPPKPSARDALLAPLRNERCAHVFFEAPHRVAAAIADLATAFGAERRIAIARELTKRFETLHETTLGEACAWIAADDNRRRGEFVLIVEGAAARTADREETLTPEDERILDVLRARMPASGAAGLAAEITGRPRRLFYRRAIGRDATEAAAADEDASR